ncbi:MAG: hypothetical protein GW905_09050 [Rhodobacterales bacterium]|nr:hypothetical protein [Rhodobacterales bacterium]
MYEKVYRLKSLKKRGENLKFGPLSILALLLVVSSVLRFLGGPASAIAKEMSEMEIEKTEKNTPPQCDTSPDIQALLAALSDREARVAVREDYYDKRSVDLAKAEQEISQQLVALEEAEGKLEATLARAANAAEDDVARLTAVYESMRPKEAALLFETMSPAFAAGFLGRMRPDVAAKVIEGLSPENAYSISVILAGRNANAPTE